MCSTMRLIFNFYSTFNALFNIQLRLQHSTIHFIFVEIRTIVLLRDSNLTDRPRGIDQIDRT